MSILENAELVESRKIDQYTYFRRNEEVIREFGEWYNKKYPSSLMKLINY